jgi:hypothetical protein
VEEMFRGAGEEFAEAIVSENLLSVDLEGEGYITLWLEEFNEEGKMVVRDSVFSDQSIRIGDLSLTTERPFVNFKRRVIFSQGTKFFRLGIEHAGKSRVRIKQISISKLVPSSTLEVASLPPKMEKKLNTPILAPR